MARIKIHNVSQAVGALGGHLHVARLWEIDSRLVTNWLARGLPANMHWSMGTELRQRGFDFDPVELFGQRPRPTRRP